MFRGFTLQDVMERKPRTMIFVLAEELKRTNDALAAVNEEMKHLREMIEPKEQKEQDEQKG